MRRALLVALAALALAAPPAGAQTPIAGGGSFNDAPVLEPGRYADTLRGGEQLFYAVELKPGQKLTAGATVKGRTDSSYFMTLQIYNPVREDDVFDGEQTASYGQTDRSASLRVEGQRVGEADGGTSDDLYAEPGTYYVSLAADDRGQQPRGRAVRHLDRPPGDGRGRSPRRRRPRRPSRRRPPTPADETAGLGGGGGDGGGGELGMAIVLGLALGGLVGFGVRRLRTASCGRRAAAGVGRARARPARAGREVAPERADERAEDEHDPEHALALGVAVERVLEQGVDERERDRPDGADERAPGRAERRRGGCALARDGEAGEQRRRQRQPDEQHEHQQEDDRAGAVAVVEEPVGRRRWRARRRAAPPAAAGSAPPARARGARRRRASRARACGRRGRRRTARVDERDRQRAGPARALVRRDVDDPDRGADRGRDEQDEAERPQRGEHRRAGGAGARGDLVGGRGRRRGEHRARSASRSAPTAARSRRLCPIEALMSPVSSAGMIIRNANTKAPPAATPRRMVERRAPQPAELRARQVEGRSSVGTSANSPGATRLVSRKASNSASFSKPRERRAGPSGGTPPARSPRRAEEADQRRVGQRGEHEPGHEHDGERPDADHARGDDGAGVWPSLPSWSTSSAWAGAERVRGALGGGRLGPARSGSGGGLPARGSRLGLAVPARAPAPAPAPVRARGSGSGGAAAGGAGGGGARRRRLGAAAVGPPRSAARRSSGRTVRGPPAGCRTGRRTPSRAGRLAPAPAGGTALLAQPARQSEPAAAAAFLLRIEDTDRERSTPENVEQIFDALRWLELDWDEEPVFQSERGERHAEVVQRLLDDGPAYRSTAGRTRSRPGTRSTATAASAARTRGRARCACASPTTARSSSATSSAARARSRTRSRTTS